VAAVAAFGLALPSAVAGFDGGVLLLPVVGRISDTTFTTLVEAGLLAAGALFLTGIA
jgi:hypothetical protein